MADFLGSYNAASSRTTVRFSFTTHAQTGAAVAPSSAFENADILIYKDGSATQRSSVNGITMTSPFDSITGLHHVSIDLTDNTDAGFYAAGSWYMIVLSPDTETVDSLAVVRVLAYFEIGPPQVNTVQVGGTAQTARDIGASVLLSAGTGTGQLDFTSGVVKSNATQWLGGTIPAVNVTGVPLVDAKYLLGTIFATPNTAGLMDVNAKQGGGVAWNSGSITSSTLAADCITSTQWAASATTEVQSGLSTYAGGDTSGTTTLLARLTATRSGYLDNLSGGAVALASGVTLSAGDSPVMQSGTATAGGASTITIQTALGADSLPVGSVIKITGGTGANQARIITGYVNATKVVTVDRAWVTNPDNTSVYSILYAELPKLNSSLQILGLVLADTVTNYTGDTPQTGDVFAQTNSGTFGLAAIKGYVDDIGVAGAGLTALGDTRIANLDATVTSRMATYTQPTGFLAATFPSGTIANTTNITAAAGCAVSSIGTDVINAAAMAASGNAEIAAAVWDLATSGHTTSGTFGAAMNAAGSAGDPWSTDLPGAYGSGTAGFILGTNLDALISSRSSYAGGDTSGTTTLLSRLTATRAGYVDNLSAGAVATAALIAALNNITAASVWAAGTRTLTGLGFTLAAADYGTDWLTSTGLAASAASEIAAAAATAITGGTAISVDGSGHLTLAGTQTFNNTGTWTGGLSGSVGSVTGNVGGNVTGSIGSLATQAKADVNAELIDVYAVDTHAMPVQGAAPATPTYAEINLWLYDLATNPQDANKTTGFASIYNRAGTVVNHKRTIADDGSIFSLGALATGP